jgi:hypothetical protein
MKLRFLTCLLILGAITTLHAQLTVQGGFTAQQLADHLAGPGFTVTNAILIGDPAARGKFQSNATNLGVNSGVVLSTGMIADAAGPAFNFASTGFQRPGDPNLDILAGINTNDAMILQFDFLVESDNIQFNFVFASEEYPEFAPPSGGVNDVFAFYISGPGITGMENIALIPGTTAPVSINNINAVTYWQYYVDNTNGTQVNYDGFTTKLTARRSGLTPCQTYRLSLRIADAADDIYDSAVFLEENSLVQGVVSAVTNTVSGDSIALEGCIQASFTFNLDSIYSTPTNIAISVGGTATNGVDYDYIDSIITIPAGQQSATIILDAIADGFTEGQETVILSYQPDPCSPPQQVYLYINDNTSITFTSSVTDVGCAGTNTGQIQLNISGGTAPYTIVLNGVDTFQTATITGLPAGVYGIEVLDNYGCGASSQIVGGQYPGQPVFLPDGGGQAYTTTIPITGFPPGTTLTNVNMLQSVCVDMEHSFMGQLEMRLYAPNGSYVVLKEHPGGSVTNLGEPVANGPVDTNNPDTTMGVCYTYCFNAAPTYGTMVSEANNFTYTYTDVVGTVLTDKYLPTGSYEPFQPFNGLLGTPLNGNWSIWVRDFNPQNNGWVCSWSVSLSNNNSGDTVTIGQPAAAVLTAVVTNATCGNANGGVNLSVTGPSTPFTYLWSTGATTQDITNVGAGSYTVTVTNALGCTTDSTFLVSNTTGPTVTQVTTQVTCPGGSNGGVNISVSGAGPFTYLWSNGATTQDITNVAAGSYTVTVTGSGNCQRLLTAAVTEIPGMVATATLIDEHCGQEDGGIQLAVSGGTASYTYAWSNGATTASIALVPAGTYGVTITDANGCSLVRSYTLVNLVGNCFIPCDLALTGAQLTPETCGNGTGAIDLAASSSHLPITYNWSTGATTQDLANLSAGWYYVTATDANSCVERDSFQVTNQTGTLAVASIAITNEYCGNGQGGVNLTMTGGAAPYSYAWSNGATTQNLSNLSAGAYHVTITDGNGCQLTTTATVANIAGTMALTWGNPFPETCGNGQGSIDITVTGGAQPLSYLWSNGATTEDLILLSAGTYSCTVTDFNNCSLVAGPYVVGNNAGTLTIFDIDLYHENCSNQGGAINLDISGGSLPYTYAWSNGATTQDLNNISSGTYSCTVTDANGCAVSTGPLTILNNPGSLTLALTVQPEICGNGLGAVNLSTNGGVSPIGYLWSTASTSQDLVQVSAGSYSVTVTDVNGCVAIGNATVTNQAGALTITNAVITPEVCGNLAGAIDLSVGGTSAPVTYLWSSGATTQDIGGQPGGVYAVTVSDASGCSANAAYTIPNQSGTLALSGAIVSNAVCGNANGSIDLSVTGGATPYTYLWSNGVNIQDINNALPATLTCTITDNLGCSIVAGPYVIGNSSGTLAVTQAAVTQPVCSNANGAIDLTVTGQAPFTYLWNSGATTQDRINLAPGSYSVTITDGNGCQVVWAQTVTASAGTLTAAVATVTDAVCGNNGGAITLNVSGGGTYAYLWSNGATTANLSGVAAGTYSVTVSSGGCTQVLSSIQVANQSGTLNVVSVVKVDAICGAANGAIDVTISGGTAPITYLWSNGATTEDISSLAPGVYTCTITATGGCTQVVSAAVLNSSGNLVLVADSVVAATCGAANGAIYLTIGGATGTPTYQWSNSATTASITAVPAGGYTCLVTDQATCAFTYSGQVGSSGGAITFPATSVVDAQCSAANGGVDITPVGGTAPYTYLWNNGVTTQDLQNVGAGNYTVTVTDASGCTATTVATVGSSGGSLTVTLVSLTAAACGTASGAIDITPNGGGLSHTYLWSNGSTTQDLSGIAAGTYTVTVTGSSGCVTTETYVVPNQSAGASVSGAQITDESCANNTGAVDITVTGGTAPLTYLWSNGATTQDLSSIHAGSYTVTITDASGCTSVAGPYTVFNNTGTLSASGTTTPELCGNGQGSVDLSVVGGSTPYTYLWNTGAVTQDLPAVTAGSYTVTVTDGSSCQLVHTYVVVLSQGTLAVSSAVVAGALCGNPTGAVDITPTGGTPPYSYLWSNGATTQDISGVVSGNYTLDLSDAMGCLNSSSYTVPLTSALSIVATYFQDETCSQVDGFVQVDVVGGDSNYTYTLNGGLPQNFNFYFGLAAGTYIVEITDGQGCSISQAFVLQDIGNFNTASNVTDATCASCPDGAIDLTITPPGNYFFYWSTGDMTEDITGLLPGYYDVQISGDFCFQFPNFWVSYPNAADPRSGIDLQLYPNPTSGSFNISYHIQELAPLQVRVVDMMGKTILQKELPMAITGVEELDLSGFPDGQYLVILQGGDKVTTRHLAVQK